MTQNLLLEAYRKISLSPVPACQCDECYGDPDLIYTCKTCDRSVPYCYGADDDMYESCDACWVATYGEVA